MKRLLLLVAALLFVIAAVLAFLTNEPLEVALGLVAAGLAAVAASELV